MRDETKKGTSGTSSTSSSSKKKHDKKKKKTSGSSSPKSKKKSKKKQPAKNPITIELERIRKLEQNPTLRWEHAKQDPAAEEARLKKYKEERRKRYRQHRAKVVEAARAQQGPNISLRPPP